MAIFFASGPTGRREGAKIRINVGPPSDLFCHCRAYRRKITFLNLLEKEKLRIVVNGPRVDFFRFRFHLPSLEDLNKEAKKSTVEKRLILRMKICASLNWLEAKLCIDSRAVKRGCLKLFSAELVVLFQKGIHFNYKADIDRLQDKAILMSEARNNIFQPWLQRSPEKIKRVEEKLEILDRSESGDKWMTSLIILKKILFI